MASRQCAVSLLRKLAAFLAVDAEAGGGMSGTVDDALREAKGLLAKFN